MLVRRRCAKADKAESAKCFLDAATVQENQTRANEFIAIKALYMVGILGTAANRDELIEALPKLTSMTVRVTALKVIAALTKSDGYAAAARLERFYYDAEANDDTVAMQAHELNLQTAARLRARSAK